MTQLPLFQDAPAAQPQLGRVPPVIAEARPANDVRPDLRRIAEGARGVVRAIDAVLERKAGEPWR